MVEYFQGQDIECERLTPVWVQKMQRQVSDVLENKRRLLNCSCAQINYSLWKIGQSCKNPYYPLKTFNYLLMSQLLIDFINDLDITVRQSQRLKKICSLRIHQSIKIQDNHHSFVDSQEQTQKYDVFHENSKKLKTQRSIFSINSSFQKKDYEKQGQYLGTNKNVHEKSLPKEYQQTITKMKRFIQRLERTNMELQGRLRQSNCEKNQFLATINKVLEGSQDWSSIKNKTNNLNDHCKTQRKKINPQRDGVIMEQMEANIERNRDQIFRLRKDLKQSKMQQYRLRQTIRRFLK